jgi:Holliday junction resolvase RusA-like endonuclease
MRICHGSPEYRIIVPGKATSFRSPKAKKYKNIINDLAKHIIPNPIIGNTVEVRLDYFHMNKRRMDMDNIAKCVIDALNGIAYVDDRQVILQAATAYSLTSIVNIDNGIVDLIKPLAQYEEYLFIRIRKVPDASTVYDKRE